jgi:hypothetical protein
LRQLAHHHIKRCQAPAARRPPRCAGRPEVGGTTGLRQKMGCCRPTTDGSASATPDTCASARRVRRPRAVQQGAQRANLAPVPSHELGSRLIPGLQAISWPERARCFDAGVLMALARQVWTTGGLAFANAALVPSAHRRAFACLTRACRTPIPKCRSQNYKTSGHPFCTLAASDQALAWSAGRRRPGSMLARPRSFDPLSKRHRGPSTGHGRPQGHEQRHSLF